MLGYLYARQNTMVLFVKKEDWIFSMLVILVRVSDRRSVVTSYGESCRSVVKL